MAQPGSAPVLGTGGRKFESYRPDHLHYKKKLRRFSRRGFFVGVVHRHYECRIHLTSLFDGRDGRALTRITCRRIYGSRVCASSESKRGVMV